MLLTDKGRAVLMIILEVLLTLGLMAGSVCIAVFVQDIEIKIVSLACIMLPLIALVGVTIGFTVFFYIDEL